MTISLRLLAEDILVSLNGGQPLASPPPLPVRQVRLWCAEAIAAVFRAKLDAYEQQGRILPDEWSTGFTLPVQYTPYYNTSEYAWRLRYKATVPGSIHNPKVRLSIITVTPVENAFAAHAGRGYGKWNRSLPVASFHLNELRVSLPMDYDAIESVDIEGFLLPNPELLLDNPDVSLGIPLPWLSEITAAVLQKGSAVLGQGSDTANNATTSQADRAPKPA